MITQAEKEAIAKYLEFLLVKDFIEPVIMKHVKDEDVVSGCFDKVFNIIDELTKEIDNHCHDITVDASNRTK